MSRKGFRWVPVLLSVVAFWSCQEEKTLEFPETKIDFKPGQLSPAAVCGGCHKDIFSVWRASSHATSMSNPIFRTAMDQVAIEFGEESTHTCLTCHAPATVVTGYDLDDPLVQEGVSCDFCHSLTDTSMGELKGRFTLDVGPVKFGPVEDAVSTGHDVAYSEFHESSLQCAGCHEYSNQAGVEILSTYSEWQDYRAKGGVKNCQTCHMPLVLAFVVDPKIKRLENSFVNLHSMPGGHSRDQLARSLRMKILEVDKSKDSVYVKIQLKNEGAGHNVPTGSPSRKVILNLDVQVAGADPIHREKLYQRILLDEKGEPILEDSQILFKAASVQSDSRLTPGEERIEEFRVPVLEDRNIEVIATLTYVYSPHNRAETETRVDFFSERRKLLSTWIR